MPQNALNHRLSALDASFLYLEHETVPMHIGGIDVFGGIIDTNILRDEINARLKFIPRYRQRILTPPMNLGHPTWEDDPDFDIRNHIVEIKLPKAGTDEQFQRMCSKLFAGMLDREKPLWKIYVIQGLNGGRTGMLMLIHHCMVDGVSGAELLGVLLDPTPTPPKVEPEPYTPEPLPDAREVVIEAIWDNISDQLRNWSDLQKNVLGLARDVKGDMFMSLMREMPTISRDLSTPVRNFPFNTRKFSGKRRLAWSDVSFREARSIRSEIGGTVNDVVLATLGGAVRRYLKEHGMKIDRQNLRVMIPVSLRKEDQRSAMGNLVSMLPIDIPLSEKNPVNRMQAITDRTMVLKTTRTAEWINLANHLWQGMTPALQALIGKAMFQPELQNVLNPLIFSPGAHMIATNVPGPQIPLYTQGLRTERHVPLLPVVPGMGLNLGIFSYNHRLNFGLIADTQACPDVDRFNEFLLESYVELRSAAGIQEVEPIVMRHSPLPPKAIAPRKPLAAKTAASKKSVASRNGTSRKPRVAKKSPKRTTGKSVSAGSPDVSKADRPAD